MDTKDIYSEIKERMRSPLFGSFVIIWLLWNWEIPVGLIVLDQNQLKSLGFQNYIDFIKGNTVKSDFWIPLSLAMVYSFTSPLLNSGLKFLRYWATSLYNKWEYIYASNKNLYVPIQWFLRLNNRYLSKSEEVSETIKTLDQEQKHIQDIKSENQKMELQISDLEEKVRNLNSEKDWSILNGVWDAKFDDGFKCTYRFSNNGAQVFDDDNPEGFEIGYVQFFQKSGQQISFLLVGHFEKIEIRFFQLSTRNSDTSLDGSLLRDGQSNYKLKMTKRESLLNS